MRIQRTTTATFAIAGVLTCLPLAAHAGAVGSTSVERIESRAGARGREVVIHTSREPTFSVFRLSDPYRVLVDVNDARMPSPIELMKVQDGVVRYVSSSAFADEQSSLVRVEIALERNAEYKVRGDGKSIVVHIDDGAASARAASETPSVKAEAINAGAETVEPAPEAAVATPVSARLGALAKKTGKGHATLSAKLESGSLAPEAIRIEHVEGPSRLVVDIAGAEILPKWQKLDINKLGVRRARTGASDTGVRIVLDLVEGAPAPRLDVNAADGKLELALSKAAPAKPVEKAAEPVAEPQQVETVEAGNAVAEAQPEPQLAALAQTPARAEAQPVEQTIPTQVTDVRFEPKDGFVRLTVVLSDERAELGKDSRAREESPMLRLGNVILPASLERTLDLSAVAGETVQSISTYHDGNDVVLAASIGSGTEHRHWRKGNRVMWDFRTNAAAARVLPYPEQATSGYVSTAVEIASMAPSAKRYTGRRISLDLKDAEIQNVLRLLADVSKLNIVAADDVKGKVTIKLKNVPWDQALDIILRSKQLDKVQSGNIIRVAPVEVLRKEEDLRIERQKARVELEPLAVRLIPVSYAVANDVKAQVAALLSPRGKVNIDVRTNVLVVEDIAEVLLKVERLVRTLDTQTPQVLIEARIVEARTNFARQLGIQWGGTLNLTQQYGTDTGLRFPNNIRIAGGADDAATPTEGVANDPNYIVNLPRGGAGALGFVFGSAGSSAILSLRLGAAETTGKAKIVSAPKIVTLDNKTAKILSGERIPITVITANGPTTRFIDANLELNVTPHVTQDGSVLMSLNATRNTPGQRVDQLGVPSIIVREATTEMLVRDGDTAVLGGIYQRNAQESKVYVPWLGQIPVLGWLFKATNRNDDREELLIFVSPRIVNRNQALVTQ